MLSMLEEQQEASVAREILEVEVWEEQRMRSCKTWESSVRTLTFTQDEIESYKVLSSGVTQSDSSFKVQTFLKIWLLCWDCTVGGWKEKAC